MIVSEIPQQSQNRLIQVSDDEEESDGESVIDSDDDIDSDTTTESGDSDEEEENDLGQQSGGSTNADADEIKKVNISEILGDSVQQLDMLEEDTDAKIIDTENKVIHLTKHTPENDDSSDEDDSSEEDGSDLGSEPEELSFIENDDENADEEDSQLNNLDKLTHVTPLTMSPLDVTSPVTSPVLVEEASKVEESSNVEESSKVEEVKKITPTEEVINYKKVPVRVLKEIVASKGLHAEPSKLRKAELLKLLQQS